MDIELKNIKYAAFAIDILPTAKAGGFLLRDAHARARECSLRH